MIATRLIGGLGNQMFQYAAGKSLALRHNTDLKVDLSWFSNKHPDDTPRIYELSHFSRRIEFANPKDIPDLNRGLTSRVARKLKAPNDRMSLLGQNGSGYNPTFEKAGDNTALVGFWQSEKYFNTYSKEIRELFAFPALLDKDNQTVAKEIEHSNAVSLHVRRGDYALNAAAQKYHGLTPIEYYRKAIEIMTDRLDNARFFVFSDDIDWCRKNIAIPGSTTFIDHNKGNQSFRDMQLMSLCQHHIVANSSFSWWGAWLNPSSSKTVIAPSVWFKDPSATNADIAPEEWIKL